MPISTKFCMRLRWNVISSKPIVCETNRKQFSDFRGVQIPISEMCKYRIRFRLVHHGTITYVNRSGFLQILHADQKCDGFYVRKYKSDFRDEQILVSVSISAVCNGWTSRDAIWLMGSDGTKKPRVRRKSRSPHKKGQLWGERSVVKYRHALLSAVQKRLNQLRCRLGCWVRWTQGTTY